MGNSVAKAQEAAAAEKEELDHMLTTLENRLEGMKLKLRMQRGTDGVSSYEVAGGRTVLSVSEIRVADGSGPDEQITEALGDFFDAAQGGVASNNAAAKKSALAGAKSLLTAGINALFGVSSGQGMERESFVVLFMNNAFVRVDYFLYTYSVSAKAWGADSNKSGCCYVTELAVLDMATLNASEIAFLLSQALQITPDEMNKLMELKVRLIETSILSAALKKSDLSFEDLQKIVKQLGEAQKTLSTVFAGMDNFVKPLPVAPQGTVGTG